MNSPPSSKNWVSVLWTGGWDSTFQLLRLLLTYGLKVKPYYLIDEGRHSSGVEIWTMTSIKRQLFKKYPHTTELLYPTSFFAVASLRPDPEIATAFSTIVKSRYLGSQYDWLARFCKEKSVTGMQLCIHRDDKAHSAIEGLVTVRRTGELNIFHLDPRFGETAEYALFKYFDFPILELSKIEMGLIAEERGWMEEMELTRFCHNPVVSVAPCGKCNPCSYTREEGLVRRVPEVPRVCG